MPAYKIAISIYKCVHCPKRATHEVFNGRNSPVGHYCSACADRAIRLMEKETS